MGFKLKSFGRHLAGNMGKVAQGVADKLECSVIAPPIPVMLGALAVCAGAAVVRNIKNRKRKNHQNRPPQAPTSETSSPSQPAATSANDNKISSPRSPVASPTHVPSIAPFRLKDTAVRPLSVPISNGQLAVLGPPATPEAGPAAIASPPDSIPSTTPSKDAENGLDYDDSEETEELSKLQHHYRASKALADISNRGGNNGSLITRKRVPALDWSQMVQEDIQVREASAQLNRPNKRFDSENEAIT